MIDKMSDVWYNKNNNCPNEVHILIRIYVFHYELELIHPFADGNGRVGRLWHTLQLSK